MYVLDILHYILEIKSHYDFLKSNFYSLYKQNIVIPLNLYIRIRIIVQNNVMNHEDKTSTKIDEQIHKVFCLICGFKIQIVTMT